MLPARKPNFAEVVYTIQRGSAVPARTVFSKESAQIAKKTISTKIDIIMWAFHKDCVEGLQV